MVMVIYLDKNGKRAWDVWYDQDLPNKLYINYKEVPESLVTHKIPLRVYDSSDLLKIAKGNELGCFPELTEQSDIDELIKVYMDSIKSGYAFSPDYLLGHTLVINSTPKFNKPVEKWQTIRIRTILTSIFRKFGYPTRFGQYLGYFSGIAIWLPINYKIMTYATIDRWNKYPENRWRMVMIAQFLPPVEEYVGSDIQGQNAIDMLQTGLMDLSSNLLANILGINIADFANAYATLRGHDLFDNLAFYDTMHDVIIENNWSRIKDWLQKAGYEVKD